MKVRSGFVANSSSSSFLVAFPHKPTSEEELKSMMFPDSAEGDSVRCYSYSLPMSEVVSEVFRDIQGQQGAGLKEITSQFTHSWEEFRLHASDENIAAYNKLEREEEAYDREYWRKYHDLRGQMGIKPMDDVPKRTKKNAALLDEYEALHKDRMKRHHEYYNAKEKLTEKMAKQTAKVFAKKCEGKWIGEFSYADEDGPHGSVMEHGGIFENLEGIRFSHH